MENTPNLQPQLQETAELEQQAVLHDMEVVARSLDMVPRNSELGVYLAAPDKQFIKDASGRDVLQETGLSNYDKIKQDTEKAIDDFNQGKVAKVQLVHGMVNGHLDAHKGSTTKNLRYAFEDLRHMGITGNAGFHTMLNPSGRTIGKLELQGKNEDTGDQNSDMLAKGAAAIRAGENMVMFNDYKDEPRTKMYGMVDPTTGERLQNVFLAVGSGTFSDKEGTASNFSNLAWAEIVLIPDEKIAAVSEKGVDQPNTQEIDMKPELDADTEVFDIDKVDWEPFQHDTFKVKRTGGTVDNGGWNLREVQEKNGTYYAVITAWSAQGTLQKTIPMEDLVRWQSEEA